MHLHGKKQIEPRQIRLETSTVCQLKCPACPTASGVTGKNLGLGFLTFERFKAFLDDNPEVSQIELSNWGEVFLNRDIVRILAYGYRKNVALTIANGTNLNTVNPEILEALVKYKLRSMTCSIDGASQESYEKYRVKGKFETVIANIRKINEWKKRYRSDHPHLRWQYVAFAHNEHEIAKARQMAGELNMTFDVKLSWGDLYGKEFSPVRNRELIRKESGLDVADRGEYRQKYGHEYFGKEICLELWHRPQINIDGRMLGCSINFWGDYGNVFDAGLYPVLNNEKMAYARDMLMGFKEARKDIPCTTCKIYAAMKRHRQWISPGDIIPRHAPSRKFNLASRILGDKWALRLAITRLNLMSVARSVIQVYRPGGLHALLRVKSKHPHQLITSSGHSIPIHHEPDELIPWKSTHFLRGVSAATDDFQCHASALNQGHIPHEPHSHIEEEILIVLAGEADLILPDLAEGRSSTHLRVKAGDFVYYPSWFLHTLQGASKEPANYLMFKWKGPALANGDILGFQHHKAEQLLGRGHSGQGFQFKVLFQGATGCLGTLQAHASVLQPGAGYGAHKDPYDVAIVTLEGQLETIGKRFGAHSIIYYAAGEPHAMHNPGDKPARYIVFEFHPVRGLRRMISRSRGKSDSTR